MRSLRVLGIAAVTASLLASACAEAAGPGAGGGPSQSPRAADELVLRVDSCCGFVAQETALRQIPWFSLFGDGRITTLGPQIEIYPGPALPNVQETPVTDDAIDRIVQAAREAGLDESHDYMEPMTVSDAPTTIFTLVEADGTKHVTRVYALTESDDSQMPAGDREARRRLRHFLDQLGRLRDWLPEGSVGDDREFRFDELRLYARPFGPHDADPGLEQPPQQWPLAEPLATFGRTSDEYSGWRCGVGGAATSMPSGPGPNGRTSSPPGRATAPATG